MKEYKLVYDISDETYEIDFDAKNSDDARKFVDEYIYENLTDTEYENLSSVDIYDITDNDYKRVDRSNLTKVYLGDYKHEIYKDVEFEDDYLQDYRIVLAK